MKLFNLFPTLILLKLMYQTPYLGPIYTWNRNLQQDHGSGSDLGKMILVGQFHSGSGSGSATLLALL
jgi:hypothetical protein